MKSLRWLIMGIPASLVLRVVLMMNPMCPIPVLGQLNITKNTA